MYSIYSNVCVLQLVFYLLWNSCPDIFYMFYSYSSTSWISVCVDSQVASCCWSVPVLPFIHMLGGEKGLSQLCCKTFSFYLALCEKLFLVVEYKGCPQCAVKPRKSRWGLFGYFSLTASVQAGLGCWISEQYCTALKVLMTECSGSCSFFFHENAYFAWLVTCVALNMHF